MVSINRKEMVSVAVVFLYRLLFMGKDLFKKSDTLDLDFLRKEENLEIPVTTSTIYVHLYASSLPVRFSCNWNACDGLCVLLMVINHMLLRESEDPSRAKIFIHDNVLPSNVGAHKHV